MTVQVNISYEIRFKGLSARDNIEFLTVITNYLDGLNKIQDNLAKYFVNFINNIFKSKNFEIIVPVNHDDNNSRIFWNVVKQFVAKCLSSKNILFKNMVTFLIEPFREYYPRDAQKRHASVLGWAGEGYPQEKLTVENFLKFYRVNFKTDWKVSGKYYVVGRTKSFRLGKFTIKIFPFKNPEEEITLKTPVRILREKDKVDDELAAFAKVTMDFWHYFKLET